ncbi:MAG: hypothetical protein QXS19_08280 [Candidatus Methanomethylicia archaeon]
MIGLIYKNVCDETFKFKNSFYLKAIHFFTTSFKGLDTSNKIKCNVDYNILFLPYNMFRFLSCRDINNQRMLSVYKKILQIDDVKQVNYKYFLIRKRSRIREQFDSFNERTWYYIDSDKNTDLYSLYHNIYFHKILDNMYSHKGFVNFDKTYNDFVRGVKNVLSFYKTKDEENQNIARSDILHLINVLFEFLFLFLREHDVFNRVFLKYNRNKLNEYIPSYLSDDSVETIYTDILNVNMILDRYSKDLLFDCTFLMDVNHKNLEHKISSSSSLKFYILIFKVDSRIKINILITCKMSDFYNECVILNKAGKSIKVKKERNMNSQVILHRFFTLDVDKQPEFRDYIYNIETKLSDISNEKIFLS